MHPIIKRLRPYFFIGLAIFYYSFSFHHAVSQSGKYRILVIPQLTRIGDLVCATPVFRAIKEQYPKSFLAVVVAESSHTASVIKHNPHIDEIIVLRNTEYLRFFGFFGFFKRIRERGFDHSVNLAASTFGTLTSVFGRIPKRIKIVRKEGPLSEALTDWMNTDRIQYIEGEHIPALYLKALEPLAVPMPERIKKEVFLSEKGEKKAESFFKEHSIRTSDFIVGMSVTAGSEIKEWGLDKFGELAKKIIEQYHARVIFVGGSNDKEKVDRANSASGNQAIVTTDFDLEELPSLLKRFSIFISSDSGPLHMAHALSVPLIDIVGPVDPKDQAPNDERSIVVKPPVHIKPTIFAFRPAGSVVESRRAAEAITVEQVLEAFQELYSRARLA